MIPASLLRVAELFTPEVEYCQAVAA